MLALALAAVLAQAPSPSHSKKDASLEAKREAEHGRPARPGQRADRPVWAHNLRTHEIRALTGPAGIAEGVGGQADRSAFFRCWFTEREGPIPAPLLDR